MNWRRREIRFAFALAASALALTSAIAPAKRDTLKDAVYTSPTWGYSVRWRSSEWTIEQDASGSGEDVLALGDASGNRVAFTGRPSNGETPADCLDRMVAETAGPAGASGYSVVKDESGQPFAGESDYQAYLVYRLAAADGSDPSIDRIVYSECQSLAPGAAVFERQYSGPPDAFGASYTEIVDAIEGVQLPASAWVPMDPTASDGVVWAGLSPLLGSWRINAAFVPQPAEKGSLLVGLVDEAGDTRVVGFENAAGSDATIDPQAVSLTLVSLNQARASEEVPLRAAKWERRRGGRDGEPIVLAPGERATAHLDFDPVAPDAIACGDLPLLVLSYAGVDFAESDPDGALSACVSP